VCDDTTPPDLDEYELVRVACDAAFEGTVVPGLRARFFHRPDPDSGRVHSVGCYDLRGRELLRAWGFVDEEHCRASVVRTANGAWDRPTPGCPVVRVDRDGGLVTGFWVRAADGSWVGGAIITPAQDV
jgi:hypothetical protein